MKKIQAKLVLETGEIFEGFSFGAPKDAYGELVFCTAMTGYQETLTDPSYYKQIVISTAAHIGNTGIVVRDNESDKPYISGFIVKNLCEFPSNYEAFKQGGKALNLSDWLKQYEIPGIYGLDTRQIVKLIRDKGAKRSAIFYNPLNRGLTDENMIDLVNKSEKMQGQNLSSFVSSDKVQIVEPKDLNGAPLKSKGNIAVYDMGVKTSSLDYLSALGYRLYIFGSNSSAQDILNIKPDGIFVSNGPGDPSAAEHQVKTIKEILKAKIPYFGICFGHQLLARALGLKTYKLDFGHRGINQPVLNTINKTVEISAHNHGFAVEAPLEGDFETDFGKAFVSYKCLNDNVAEGLQCKDINAFSVQFHPEASAGPHDSVNIFNSFDNMIQKNKRGENA